jgi:hypothetical protein
MERFAGSKWGGVNRTLGAIEHFYISFVPVKRSRQFHMGQV